LYNVINEVCVVSHACKLCYRVGLVGPVETTA